MNQKEKNQLWEKELNADYLPHISVDCVIFGFHNQELKVLIQRWKNTTEWSLPGGRIFSDETLEAAAKRVLTKRTGLEDIFLKQFHVFSEPNRVQPQRLINTLAKQGIRLEETHLFATRTLTVGFVALVEYSKTSLKTSFLIAENRWWDLEKLPDLLFDHNKIIETALALLRRQVAYVPVGLNLLPEIFTLPQLQKLYEAIIGEEFDRRNFQRKVLQSGIITVFGGKKSACASRTPIHYQFDKVKYFEALKIGILY